MNMNVCECECECVYVMVHKKYKIKTTTTDALKHEEEEENHNNRAMTLKLKTIWNRKFIQHTHIHIYMLASQLIVDWLGKHLHTYIDRVLCIMWLLVGSENHFTEFTLCSASVVLISVFFFIFSPWESHSWISWLLMARTVWCLFWNLNLRPSNVSFVYVLCIWPSGKAMQAKYYYCLTVYSKEIFIHTSIYKCYI